MVVELPGSEIRFEPPEDMCLLRPGRSWPEFELVQAARTLVERSGEAEAFAVTADCDELDALRAREIDRLAHYGIFSLFLVDGEVRPLPDTSREPAGDLVTRLGPIVLVVGGVVAALAWRRRSVKGPGGRA